MSARVYVAAPFSEWALVREVQALVIAGGGTLSHDWTAGIESLPPGLTDADVSEEVAVAAAVADLRGVWDAEACIFLTVEDKTKGLGMWIEAGFALAVRAAEAHPSHWTFEKMITHDRHMRIAVCGPQRDRTIFSRLGKRFADWRDALPYVLGEEI